MHEIIVLWSIPRSRSTAFERMMIARGDHAVFHEPFADYFYFSDERLSLRKNHVIPKAEFHYQHILEKILEAAKKQPVFIKDHAYHIAHIADRSFLSNFKNTFIIRDPKEALPSHFHGWPDITVAEAGYAELYHLAQLASTIQEKAPVIIEADDLVRNPVEIVQAYCRAVDIRFIPESLQWDATVSHPDWDRIDNGYWHARLKQTCCFQAATQKNIWPLMTTRIYTVCISIADHITKNCMAFVRIIWISS